MDGPGSGGRKEACTHLAHLSSRPVLERMSGFPTPSAKILASSSPPAGCHTTSGRSCPLAGCHDPRLQLVTPRPSTGQPPAMTPNATVGVMPVPAVMTSVLSAAREGVVVHPLSAPDTVDCLDGGDREDQRPLRQRTQKDVGKESVVVGEAEKTLSSSERGETTSLKPRLVHPRCWEDRVASWQARAA